MFPFNIRVYGILINDRQQVLVSDELIKGKRYTKFPGGGLEYGEGTRDCLAREFMEEMNLQVAVTDHIYTTDYFQLSAFNPAHQIISIYYKVKPLGEITVKLSDTAFNFSEEDLRNYSGDKDLEAFRFIDWTQLSEDSVTLPIDKIVVGLLKQNSAVP